MPGPEKRLPHKKSHAMIYIVVCCLILIGILGVALPSLRKTKHYGGFIPVPAYMKTIGGAVSTYMKKDYDKNGVRDYPLSIRELRFILNSQAAPVALISHQVAIADCWADGDPNLNEIKWHTTGSNMIIDDAAPISGYWIGVIKYMSDGSLYSDSKSRSAHFAICAFPHAYGEDFGSFSEDGRGYGVNTYIMNEEGIIYKKDTGAGKYIEKWPSDFEKEGWVQLKD